MRERNLAWSRHRAPADQPGVRDRMMGRPERANRQQRLTGPEQARDTVDPRALDRLIQRHRRENSGKPLRQHRLPRSWGTDQQDVVPAGRRHL